MNHTLIVGLDWVKKYTTPAEQEKLKAGLIVSTANSYVTCVENDAGFCFMVHPKKPDSVEAVYDEYYALGGI